MTDITINVTDGTATSGTSTTSSTAAMLVADHFNSGTFIRRNLPLIDLSGLEPPEPAVKVPRRGPKKDWYRIENQAPDTADVWIYDEISDPFMSEMYGIGISALGFARDLQALKGTPLNVHINSPGGSVFEGLAVYNLLRQHDAPVNGVVDGIAASIASVIAMGCDTLTMAPHSMMMIHDASGLTIGNADDHRQQAGILDKLSEDIAAVYNERGDSRRNWRGLMKAETWLTADEAVSVGLADGVGAPASAPSNRFDLSRFRNVPEELVSEPVTEADRPPTKRTLEDAVRDAGLSGRLAKAFVSEGWKALEARDESESEDEPEETEAQGEEIADESAGTVPESESAWDRRESRARDLELMRLAIAV